MALRQDNDCILDPSPVQVSTSDPLIEELINQVSSPIPAAGGSSDLFQ